MLLARNTILSPAPIFIILTFVFLIFLPTKATASHKTFSENFDSYTDGSFPSGWIVVNDAGITPCLANWKVSSGMVGIEIINQNFCTTNLMPNDSIWNGLGDNYVIDLDMKFVQGTDHNIAFRFTELPTANWYDIHFQSPSGFVIERVPPGGVFVSHPVPNRSIPYHLKITVDAGRIKVEMDNTEIIDHVYNPIGELAPTGRVALRAGTGSDPNSITYFDNLVVTSIDDILAVPYFSQNIQPWGPSEYDHASSLNFTDTTMNRWGCAVTSAAMILNYHGMKEFADGTQIDPGTLNDWLKDNNGYQISKLSDGSFNSYLFLPRIEVLTKNLLDAGKSNVVLKHNRPAIQNPGIKSIVDEDLLTKKIPVMLKVTNSQTPSHFVVATGVTNNTYSVNDPEWNASDLSFFDRYIQVDQFIPTQTNLSYIGIISNPDVELLITDSLGRREGKYIQAGNIQEHNEIPNSSYQFDTPISNPNSVGIAENFGTGGNVFLLPEPDSGIYQITLSSNTYKEYSINLPTQDKDGRVSDTKYTGTVNQNSPDIINLNFDQQNSSSSSSQRLITFQSMLDDINEAESLELINAKAVKTLKRLVEQAWNNFQRGHTKQATMKLNDAKELLESERGDGISETEYQILNYDIDYLLTLL